jgi:predicted transcriptional regulator
LQLQCEFVAQHFLPIYRSLIAQELLTKYGLSQVEVAKKLDITQAAVSQYLYKKRGKREIQQPYFHKIEDLAKKTAHEISHDKIPLKNALCRICELYTEIITTK